MTYYRALGLKEEPFSNSPSPELFFNLPGRAEILNLLEVSVRLKRGLNIVLGEVGTGKTTLCRQLLRNLGEDKVFLTLLLLDPYFDTPLEFLRVMYSLLYKRPAPPEHSPWLLKEAVKKGLLHLALERNRIVVLVIDEGQKIQDECLELLREFLNFETNQNKLLQIVIFAQNEFRATLVKFPNLVDRVDSLHQLRPMSFFEMRDMIRFRLDRVKDGDVAPELFSLGAYWAIHRITRGYPRKVMNLCHKTLLGVLMLGRPRATMTVVYKSSGRRPPQLAWGAAGALCAGCVAAAFLYVMPPSVPEVAVTDPAPEAVRLQAESAPVEPVAAAPLEARPEAPAHEAKAAAQLALAQEAGAQEQVASESPPEVVPQQDEAAAAVAAVMVAPEVAPGGQAPLASVASSVAAVAATRAPEQQLQPAAAPAASETTVQSAAAPLPVETQSVKPVAKARPLEPAVVKAEVQPERQVEQTAATSSAPVLGSVVLEKGQRLAKVIGQVYGVYRNEYLHQVLRANPQIKDPDKVAAGEVIAFPRPAPLSPQDLGERYWLSLGSYGTLEQALHALAKPPYVREELRLLPVADKRGLQFLVVAAERYKDERAALDALASLPPALQGRGVIVRHFEQGTQLLTDKGHWAGTLAER